jgi:Protein of unknown function (DUF3667)
VNVCAGILSAGVVAYLLDRSEVNRGMASGERTTARKSLHCRNCGALAPDEYCPHCGQSTNEHLPTACEFVHELVLHYFAAEGRFWRTLTTLVLHPGRLTIEYLRGRKAAYVVPIRLYLTLSIVFFLALRLAMTPSIQHVNAAFHRSLNEGHAHVSIFDFGFAKAIRNPDGSLTCSFPMWFCSRIQEQALRPPGELERRLSRMQTELYSHLSTAVFLLLPLFAFYLQLAYSTRTYGEHFLFALHVHSLWFLVLLLLLLPTPEWTRLLLQSYLVVYSVAALHAVYSSAWWKTLLKGLAVGLAYAASLFIAVALIGVWAIVG